MDTPVIKEEFRVLSQSAFHRYMTGPSTGQASSYRSSINPIRKSSGILSYFKLDTLEKALMETPAKELKSLPDASSPQSAAPTSVLPGLKAAT